MADNAEKQSHRYHVRDLTDQEIKSYEMRVTNLMVDYPRSVMCCCCTWFTITVVVVIGMIGISFDQVKMEDKGDIRTLREEAVFSLRTLLDQMPTGKKVIYTTAPKQVLRSVPLAGIHMIYDGRGGSILTLEKLAFIQSVEQKIFVVREYKNSCELMYIPLTPEGILAGHTCPGLLCPWYRTIWDYTLNQPLPDGSKAVCSPPLRSLTWHLWNLRIATGPTAVPCDLLNNFEDCMANGYLVMLPALNDGKTMQEKLASVELGGVAPTQLEINGLIRLVGSRMESDPRYAMYKYFFDKSFGNAFLPDTALQKWVSDLTRTTLVFGGPLEKENPNDLAQACHERSDEATCAAAGKHCSWVTHAGTYQNATGCAAVQFYEVTRQAESDINTDQHELFGKRFAKDVTKELDDADGPVDVLYLSEGTIFDKFLEIMARDALLAMISFFFVYLYIQIHTGSFFLATLGMLQVVMPFTMGFFVYRLVFQIQVFYGLSALTLFIVLAIGADDIFVFMDSWTQADVRPRDDNCTYMKGRFAQAWKHAGKAMGITSVTTMCAFIATMSSPLADIRYFGLFAAILIFFDYVLVMTFFASCVVVYHRNYEHTIGCCCCGIQACGQWCNCCTCFTTLFGVKDEEEPGCMQSKLAEPRMVETVEEARADLGPLLDFTHAHLPPKQTASDERQLLKTDTEYKKRNWAGHISNGFAVVFYLIGFVMLSNSQSTDQGAFLTMIMIMVLGLFLFAGGMNAYRAARARSAQLGLAVSTETIFTKVIAPFLAGTRGVGKRPYVRLLPTAVLWGVFVLMITAALKLEPTTKNEQMLPNWHPIQRFVDSMSQDFPSSEQVAVHPVSVTFGIDKDDPVNRDGVDKWDPDDHGMPIFTQSFSKAVDFSTPQFQELMIRFCDEVMLLSSQGVQLQRTFLGEKDQNCVMKGLRSFVTQELNGSFPVPQPQFLSTLWAYMKWQRNLAENLRVPLSPAEVHYDKVYFTFTDPEQPPVAIQAYLLLFNTTLFTHGNSNDKITKFYDEWESLINNVNRGALPWIIDIYAGLPYPLNGEILHASEAWVWMHTQNTLVAGAFNGTYVSLALATVIIFFGTLNLLIALIVFVELIGVVGYVMGTMQLLGWEMGTVESVSITILVGLSVDYVVHYAIHYTSCTVDEGDTTHNERCKRVFEVLCSMGPTVLGGAATSLGASLVLLLTWIQFFQKFGICFLFTILYSYVWATFFFLPVMSVIGPQNEFLSIRPLLSRCLPKYFPPREAKHNTVIPMDDKTGVVSEGQM